MRLICPNCGAQYEVEEQVIPETGRDVQCSNCGHTWFQGPPHLDEDLADELGEPPPEAEPEEEAPEDDAPEPEEEDEGLQRRGLDPEVTNVLREEAAREAEARLGEKSGLETQPDLGLDDAEAAAAAERSAAARARMKRLRGQEDDAEEPGPDAPRKDLLPDIDEINDTLRAEQDRGGDAMPEEEVDPEAGTRRGFRRGFFLILLIAAILALVYAYAEVIVAQVPAAQPFLDPYVDWVNSVRGPLNEAVQNGLAKLTELVGGLTGGGEGGE